MFFTLIALTNICNNAFFRMHLLIFPPGVLDRHYEKLLQFDKRLFELSHKPFPTQNNQYFYSNILSYTPYPSSFTENNNMLSFNVQHDLTKFPIPHCDENYKQTLHLGIVDTSSPTSGNYDHLQL